MVEIAKAISNNAKVLVLDEPTASITDKEVEILFKTIKELRANGMGIIYISHRMAELFEIGDRITVLRDGCYVGTQNIEDITEAALTRMMVGRDISFEKVANPGRTDEVVLEVRDLCYRNRVKHVSFDLHKGEILGFSGLVGAGRSEIAKCIIGAYRHTGSIKYLGKELPTSVAETAKRGVVYLSEDRKGEGLVLIHPLFENVSLPNLDKLGTPLVHKSKLRTVTADYIKKLKIKAYNADMAGEELSGGNQQKVVIAKWLLSQADVYIFDEPTRGIDVGARDEIYEIMLELVKNGASIILRLLRPGGGHPAQRPDRCDERRRAAYRPGKRRLHDPGKSFVLRILRGEKTHEKRNRREKESRCFLLCPVHRRGAYSDLLYDRL